MLNELFLNTAQKIFSVKLNLSNVVAVIYSQYEMNPQ